MENLNIKSSFWHNASEALLESLKGDLMQDNQRQALTQRQTLPYCCGLIDGDGSICVVKQKHPHQNWDIEIRNDQVSYFSGLMDAEGSFIVKKCDLPHVLEKAKRISPIYSGVIRIGMVDERPLKLLDKTFPGGQLMCEGVRKDRPTYQVMYRWELRKRALLVLALKEMIPFLIAKKEHAIVLLDYLEKWENPVDRKLGISPSELRRREEAYLRMRQLNAVGAAATTNRTNIREDEVIVCSSDESGRVL